MTVGDLGPEEVVTASPDSELGEITDTLESANVGAIVITDDDTPVGIVTDRDAALTIHQHDDVASVSVEEVMTEDPATIRGAKRPSRSLGRSTNMTSGAFPSSMRTAP